METAVEWIEGYLKKFNHIQESLSLRKAFEQAKEMEKEQIGKAFLNGRLKEIGSGVLFDLQPLTETFHNYYNKTFKSE
jgi:hypothetical protein